MWVSSLMDTQVTPPGINIAALAKGRETFPPRSKVRLKSTYKLRLETLPMLQRTAFVLAKFAGVAFHFMLL